jgi:diaminopimelate epimerase
MTHEKVRVPRIVWDGIMAVRESGETNMFDRNAVQYYADKLGYPHAVVWIEDLSRGDWGRLILLGPEITDEVDGTDKVEQWR